MPKEFLLSKLNANSEEITNRVGDGLDIVSHDMKETIVDITYGC